MKLMVIDGNSIVNRAFYGVSQNLTTQEGLPTNAIFGFLNILFKLLDEEQPQGLAVAFDMRAPTFRHKAFAEYKAQRKGMPEELAVQMPVLKDVLDAMNIRRCELEGWEADDLLGTMARRNGEQGGDTVIVTGDKDALQLVDERTTVKLVTTRMGQTTTRDMTPEEFRAQYGFDPSHMIDLKALMGDSSDNYPGVKGVGEKTAMALIRQYQTVDAIYEKLPDIDAKPGVIKKLMEGEGDARMSYDLAVIRTDAPMDFNPEDAARRPFNEPVLHQKLLELEFSKLIDKLKLAPGPAGAAQEEGPEEVRVTNVPVLTETDFAAALAKWEGAACVTVLPLPGLAGVAVSLPGDGGRQAYLYDIRAGRYGGDYHALLAALFGPTVKKAAHGVKELCRALLDEGIEPEGFVFDTELAAYLLNPTAGSYELRKLAASYFKKEVELDAAYKDETAFSLLDEGLKAQTAWYEDTAWIEAFYDLFRPRLEEYGLLSVLTDIELPLCPVLARMERAGVLVDGQALADFGKQLQTGIDVLRAEICRLAGEEVNIQWRRAPEPREIVTGYAEQALSVSTPLFQLGFKGEGGDSLANLRRQTADEILLEILCGESSPLYRRLYDGGLINGTFEYEVLAGRDYFVCMYGGESREPKRVAEAIREEIGRLRAQGIDPEAFRRCKKATYGRYIGMFSRVDSVAGLLTLTHFAGMENLYDLLEAVKELTLPELTRRLEEDFDPRYSALSVINPM